ncbi:NPFR [Lepeophtheirus salmonis]|uniref:NPFR n=1 Tax=Lepeophtheirus salmonis TaxID=72036 RepID=A0A7R8CJI8_LEPSM|nr:NPFR [Lepeophtheirus salmonis]CAF2842333.1 NPFR [Lepeophtheirus salmonis]
MENVTYANLSEAEILENFVKSMVEGWRYQARVGDVAYAFLIALYASLILFGSMGNILVIVVVIRNAAMRTARNVFIVNLAVSDLMLCLITMPLTLIEILYQTWQFGDYPFACPFAALLQATSIFVSTLSITAIALDRRHLIVKPHVPAPEIKKHACNAIWKKLENWTEWADSVNILADDVSLNSTQAQIEYMKNCSIFIDKTSNHNPSGLTNDTVENVRLNCILQDIMPQWLGELQSCREDFPTNGRFVYSSITMLIQYLLPTITISIAYYQIYGQLNLRLQQKMSQLISHQTSANNVIITRMENDIQRMRRIINLLISVGVIFCVCWLPLNILNSVMDITEKSRFENIDTKKILSDEEFCILYAVCHVMGMFSACANPVIYGYLNENFHREFMEILQPCFNFFCQLRCKKDSENLGNRTTSCSSLFWLCCSRKKKEEENESIFLNTKKAPANSNVEHRIDQSRV